MKKRWKSHIDEALEKAIRDGSVPDLPGAGKPLNLKQDANTPDDMRLAYKIMADNNVAPDWVMLGKTLEKKERDLYTRLNKAVKTYRQALAKAERADPAQRDAFKENAEKVWQAAQRTLKLLVERYNDELMTYNLKVPPQIGQRRVFDLEKEIEKALR